MVDPLHRRRVIGLGNPDRGDDAVGRRAAAGLRGRVPEDVSVIEHDGESAGLLDYLYGADAVYLVDAAVTGAAPGTIQRFDVIEKNLPVLQGSTSTHGLGLAEAVELVRALNQLPARCVVYVVEARSFAPRAALYPAVAAAVDTLSARILAELRWRPAVHERPIVQ